MSHICRDCKSGHEQELIKALCKINDRMHPGPNMFIDDYEKTVLSKAVEVSKNNDCVSFDREECTDHSGMKITSTSSRPPDAIISGVDNQQISKMKKSRRVIPSRTNSLSCVAPHRNTVTVTRVLVDVECQRKRDVQENMKIRSEKMSANRKELVEKYAAEFKAQLERQSAAKARQAQEEMRELRKEELLRDAERKQQQELEQQLHAEKVSKREEQLREAEQRAKEYKRMVDELQKHQIEYCQIYKYIHSIIIDKQALKPVLDSYKFPHETMNILLQRCKDNKITSDDLMKTAKDCVTFMKTACNHIKEEVDKIHHRLDQKLAEQKRQEEEALSRQENVAETKAVPAIESNIRSATSDVAADSLDFVDKTSLKMYQEMKDFKQNNEKLFEQLLKDNSLKKFRSDCQKAVNVPVNAISHSSASHLHDKLKKLTMLLSGQTVVISEGVRVSASAHPAGIPFCKDLLAKKFVRQGALTVSSKPEAAFPIAAVMIALWQDFPDWGRLVLAHFYEECPYLVPAFWPQLEGQSNKDYYMSLGYNYSDDGEVEKQDKFLKRMSGIMRLYAALLISRLPRDRQNKPHPHDLSNGWRWLSSLLNLEPRPGICATVIYDFLEVAGNSMFQCYGRQFQKMLLLVCKEYYPRLRKVSECSGGPVVRLELLLEQILKQGFIEPPHGILPPNFW